MLHQPPEKWLIPELNGDVRLQKPPFAYWYAIGFMAFGENELTSRLPTTMLAWMTLLITYLAASLLFDARVGVLSSAMLLRDISRETFATRRDRPARDTLHDDRGPERHPRDQTPRARWQISTSLQ